MLNTGTGYGTGVANEQKIVNNNQPFLLIPGKSMSTCHQNPVREIYTSVNLDLWPY